MNLGSPNQHHRKANLHHHQHRPERPNRQLHHNLRRVLHSRKSPHAAAPNRAQRNNDLHRDLRSPGNLRLQRDCHDRQQRRELAHSDLAIGQRRSAPFTSSRRRHGFHQPNRLPPRATRPDHWRPHDIQRSGHFRHPRRAASLHQRLRPHPKPLYRRARELLGHFSARPHRRRNLLRHRNCVLRWVHPNCNHQLPHHRNLHQPGLARPEPPHGRRYRHPAEPAKRRRCRA